MSDDGEGPYTLQDGDDERHAFWADTVADRVEERVAHRRKATETASGDDGPASLASDRLKTGAREADDPIVVKGGISPSGVPHLGNVNEIMRGYYVAEVLRERGYEVRQVFTADDADPLRKLPRTLCDLDGNLVDLGDVDAGALGRNLGVPYTKIPDPIGCCGSYGEHFSAIIQDSADALDVPIDLRSTTELYESGTLEDATRHVLANRERAREVLSAYQNKVDDSYVPFNPVCEKCGKVTETVTAIDLEENAVEYRCTDMEAGDRTIEGCGHEGTATLREGKMPWRFEWPAQWGALKVDFEPFGKDHAEGSWPSGEDIARNVLAIEPPVPMVYEWFTLDGEPFSSSAGNVILVSEVLQMLEPEVVRYFFAKDPTTARDFSVERLDLLVDEFDRFEAIYFGEVEGSEDERAFAERVYPLVIGESEAELEDRRKRIRLPYTFAAVLGMTDDPVLREEIARREGHIPEDAPEWAIEEALGRVERARNWARETENEFDYELKRAEIPDHEFDPETERALDELADFIEEGHDPDAIQGEIYETAKRHDVGVGDFFSAGYHLFFDEEQGPKLGQFLAKVDREFVVARLRRER